MPVDASHGGDADVEVVDVEAVTAEDPAAYGADRIAAALAEFGMAPEAVATAEDLLAAESPLVGGAERIKNALTSLGASAEAADAVVRELEEMPFPSVEPDGRHFDWDTFDNLFEYAAEDHRRSLRTRLWQRIRELANLPAPLGEPYVEIATVPLLVLAAPPIEGATVTWTLQQAAAGTGGFQLTVFGTGLGATKKVDIKSAWTESCERGAAKRAQLAIPVLAQPLGYGDDGRATIVDVRRELASPGPGIPPRRRQVETCSAELLQQLAGPPVEDEDRRNERSSTSLTDTLAVEGTRTLSIGLKHGDNIGATLSGELEGSREHEVTVVLPGGHWYRKRYPREAFGVIWEVVS